MRAIITGIDLLEWYAIVLTFLGYTLAPLVLLVGALWTWIGRTRT